MLGCFGGTVFDEPHPLPYSNIQVLQLSDSAAYMGDNTSQIIIHDFTSREGKNTRVEQDERVVAIRCGMDYAIAITSSGSLFGCGNNSNHQLSNADRNSLSQWTRLAVLLDTGRPYLHCGSDFVLCLLSNPPSLEQSFSIK